MQSVPLTNTTRWGLAALHQKEILPNPVCSVINSGIKYEMLRVTAPATVVNRRSASFPLWLAHFHCRIFSYWPPLNKPLQIDSCPGYQLSGKLGFLCCHLQTQTNGMTGRFFSPTCKTHPTVPWMSHRWAGRNNSAGILTQSSGAVGLRVLLEVDLVPCLVASQVPDNTNIT